MENKITLLVLAGPSAGGKTASAMEILRRDPRFTLLRSATTRAPRGDGHDGEYIYLSEDEFKREIASGGIVEHMEYAGKLYGTPYSELLRAESEGKIPLLILDLVGVQSVSGISALSPCAVYIPGDLRVIEERLRQRYLTDGCDESARATYLARVGQNRKDYEIVSEYADCFYAFLPNDGTVGDLADRILSVFSDFTLGKAPDRAKNRLIATGLRENAR